MVNFILLCRKKTGNSHSKDGDIKIEPLTVLIACKNEAHRLASLIKALENQLASAAEIIIVDDNSTDSTLKVAQQLSEQCKVNISVLQNNERGNREHGLCGNDGVGSRDVIKRQDGNGECCKLSFLR